MRRDPYFFRVPTSVFSGSEIHLGRERYANLMLDLNNVFHADNLLQSSDFWMTAAQAIFDNHRFAPSDFISFRSPFIDNSNLNQMETFARCYCGWEASRLFCHISLNATPIDIFFIYPANFLCIGICRYAVVGRKEVYLMTTLYWCQPGEWRYSVVQGQAEVYIF